jgi:DNA-binding IclR family transcriptional regulator
MGTESSLARGLKMLDLLIEVEADPVRRPRGLAIQEVANELGVHKSTASRLMRTLVQQGYAVSNADARRGFRLGPAVQTHEGLTIDQRRLRELAQPVLAQLVEDTDECAHVAVPAGAWALVIDDAETRQALRVVAGTGRRVPLHCTSAGKCLLAFGLAAIPDELPSRTSRTITNPDMLKLHLAEIGERGFAVDDEENDPGVRCISAPIYGPSGEAIGCVGIDGPSVRVTADRIEGLATSVVAASRRLSDAMADPGPTPQTFPKTNRSIS